MDIQSESERSSAERESSLRSSAAPLAVEFVSVSLAAVKRFGQSAKGWAQGERLELAPEPGNKADPNAIKVMRQGRQIGYVARVDAEKIARRSKEGWRLSGWCFLDGKKGGEWGEGTLKARLENPVMGWEGFNPFRPLAENRALMEASLLRSATEPAEGAHRPAASPSAPRL